MLWWDGLSFVERRTPKYKDIMVRVTEKNFMVRFHESIRRFVFPKHGLDAWELYHDRLRTSTETGWFCCWVLRAQNSRSATCSTTRATTFRVVAMVKAKRVKTNPMTRAAKSRDLT